MLKKILNKWKKTARAIGNLQAKIIFTAVYFFLITPIALVIKIFFDPLNIKGKSPSWRERLKDTEIDLEKARRQF